MMAACNEPEEPGKQEEPTKDGLLNFSTKSLEFTAEGETKTVDITGNNWKATPGADWIGVAEVDGGITVTVGANESTDPREGSITVANNEDTQTISVTQVGAEPPVDPTLTIDPLIVNFPVEGGEQMITVTSEPAWEAIPHADWISVELVDGGFKVIVEACPLVAGRGGAIDVLNGNEMEYKYVTVNQAGTGATPLSTFTDDVAIGEMPLGVLAYNPDQFDGLADSYIGTSMSGTVAPGRRGYTGTGYYFPIQFNTTTESAGVIPSGVYTIARNDAPWHVLGGFTPNGSVLVGLWIHKLENDAEVNSGPVVYGTVTVSRTGDIYTVVIDGLDDAGNAVTATLTGTGAVA
jgi:hypothetical protein